MDYVIREYQSYIQITKHIYIISFIDIVQEFLFWPCHKANVSLRYHKTNVYAHMVLQYCRLTMPEVL